MAFDAEPQDWITVNGAHVPLDESGQPTGKAGEAIKEEASAPGGKSFDDYKKQFDGDHYKAAREFYRKELMPSPTKTKFGELGEQDVHFTSSNLKRIQMNMEKDPLKAEAVQHLQDTLKSGKYLGKNEPYKERDDYDSFHHFQKQVTLGGKPMKLIVDVGHNPGSGYEFKAYSFIHSEAERYGEKVKHLKEAGLPAEDKKEVEGRSPCRVVIPTPENPPGDLLGQSGHRLSTDKNLPQNAEKVNDVIEGASDKAKESSDESGKVSARHASTQTGPIFSRPGLGADDSLGNIISKFRGDAIKVEDQARPPAFDAASIVRQVVAEAVAEVTALMRAKSQAADLGGPFFLWTLFQASRTGDMF